MLPILISYVGLQSTLHQALRFGRWPILLVGIALALATIYRFGPDRRHTKWRWITWGSATAALLWLTASALFSWYAANFGHFNKTYGTLGAAIGFMMWMWISAMVILAGAESMPSLSARTLPCASVRPAGLAGNPLADPADLGSSGAVIGA